MVNKDKRINNLSSFTAKYSHNSFKIIFAVSFFVFSFAFSAFANPDTLCNGKEFNTRVKAFLSGNDRGATIENTITSFKRGYNPPDDPAYYVDISEDKDGSIIAYTRDNNLSANSTSNNYTLYWYSDGIACMNSDAAFMFDKFVRIRNIDLSDFVYLKGLTDTRYMFLECRNLKTVKFKNASASKEFMPSEMQGMFFGCQSLTNVDFTLFDTKMVDNMDELFYKCYNLKNIYVDKNRWNVENVRSFTRMFSECHSLRTNEGKKAVDIPEDKYEDYAVPGDDKKEGFIKDVNYEYADYGEYIDSVPIDGANYITTQPETTQPYAEEPEYDGEVRSGQGSGNIPYVGNSESGYGDEKQSQQSAQSVITPTIDSNVEIVEPSDSDAVSETGGRRIMELDEFLKSQEQEGKDGKGEILGTIFDNYKFLIFALVISTIVILLLVGMVVYLTKSNSENKDDESHKI